MSHNSQRCGNPTKHTVNLGSSTYEMRISMSSYFRIIINKVVGFYFKSCLKSLFSSEPQIPFMIKSKTKEYISAQNKRARLKRISQPIDDKERAIIKMICAGFKSKEIAKANNLSVRTIQNDRQIIMKKIGCNNALGVVKYAVQKGIYKI